MTQYEMAQRISDNCNVSLEEARTALEAGNWNMLTAAQSLELEKLRRKQKLDSIASGCATMAAPAATAQAEAVQTEAVQAEAVQAEAVQAEAAQADADDPAEGAGQAVRAKAGKRGRGVRNAGAHIRRVVACGNRNRFVVRHNGAVALDLPVTVLVVLMLCAFWVCVPLLAIGLFAGCRYSFSGRELGREGINSALDKASRAAERVKQTVAEA